MKRGDLACAQELNWLKASLLSLAHRNHKDANLPGKTEKNNYGNKKVTVADGSSQ